MRLVKISIADRFVKHGIITSDDKELFSYGLQQGLVLLLNIFTTVIIGFAFGMVWQSVVFLIAYIPLRSYAGGYHARTQIRCYIFSVLLIITALLGIWLLSWINLGSILIVLFSGGIVYIKAPIEDPNKPLNQLEKIVFRRNSRVLLLILFGMIFLFWFINASISVCLMMAIITLSFMILLGSKRLIKQ
jgi:accessory gene regulator B